MGKIRALQNESRTLGHYRSTNIGEGVMVSVFRAFTAPEPRRPRSGDAAPDRSERR